MTATFDTPTSDLEAIAGVPGRIVAAWAAQDGPAFGEVFTENGTMVLPHQAVRRGRAAITEFMSGAFQGPYRGTRVVGEPVDLRLLSPDTAVVVTRGGVLAAGQDALTQEQAVNATWVVVRQDGSWSLAAYHNSPAEA